MVQEGRKRLPGPFSLCLSGLGEPPPLFYCPAPAARGSRHKPCHPRRQRTPSWLPCLMLIASERAASAFLFQYKKGSHFLWKPTCKKLRRMISKLHIVCCHKGVITDLHNSAHRLYRITRKESKRNIYFVKVAR
jgi:hypothetical protein